MQKLKDRKIYLISFLLLTVIFLGLYHPFLFGGQMYVYADIGADTLHQYLPVTVFQTEAIRRGELSTYQLGFGLGRFCGSLLPRYLNPVDLPLLIFGENFLHIGLMVSLFLKYVLIWLFSVLFFKRLFKSDRTACLCALLWTFSGYAVLWGQHYQFLRAMFCFTVALYTFQLYLEKNRHWYLVIPGMAFLVGTSYYHFYISCYFFLIYGVLYLAFRREKFLQILKKIGIFAIAMIPALLMAGATLLPEIETFFGSTRTGAVTAGVEGIPLFYGPKVIFAFIARLFSNNLIGVGNIFYGPTNYYECAILSVSILFFFAEFYLLQTKYRWRTATITAFSALLLCMPVTSRILVFATNTQRWTYLLCFGEVLAIGTAFADGLKRREDGSLKKILFRTVILTDLFLALVAFGFYKIYVATGGWILNMTACRILGVIVLLYHGAFLLTYCRRIGYWALIGVVAAEMIAINYQTVNDRQTPTVDEWYGGYYYDGTEETVEWIRQQDDSLHRVNKTYDSVAHMDPLIQGYNGMSIYHSTNSAELIGLAHSYGYPSAGHWIRFDGCDLPAHAMLGVRYLITESGEYVDTDFYEKIGEAGGHDIYQYRFWPGFGYVLEHKVEMVLRPDHSRLERLLSMAGCWYETNQTDFSEDEVPGIRQVNLIPLLQSAKHCEVTADNAYHITGTDDYLELYFDMPELEDGWMVSGVRIRMTAEAGSGCRLSGQTEHFGFGEEHSQANVFWYEPGEQTITLNYCLPEQPERLRLDVSYAKQNVTLDEVTLILADKDLLLQKLEMLQGNGAEHFSQEGNTFRGTVSAEMDNSMLCLPLVYDRHWRAAVDGVPAEVLNINGGVLGIELPEGTHEISVTYSDPVYAWGTGLSAVSIILFISWLCVCKWHKPKNNR